jgi:hypothetical protein
MQAVKTTKEYTVFKKRSGRHAVQKTDASWIRGNDKTQILLKEGLIKLTAPKKKEEAAAPAEAPKA